MQFDHVLRTSLLVQRVDVLRDDRPQVTGVFEFSQSQMGGIRLRIEDAAGEWLEPLKKSFGGCAKCN